MNVSQFLKIKVLVLSVLKILFKNTGKILSNNTLYQKHFIKFAKIIFQTRTSIFLCEILKFKTTICVQVLDLRYITELTSFSIYWELGNQLKSAIWEKFKHFLSLKLLSDDVLRHSKP